MMNPCVFLVFLLAFFTVTPNIAFADSSDDISLDSAGFRHQCKGFCFFIYKPHLNNFVELKEGADGNVDLKTKVNSLISTNNEDKNEHLSEKNDQLKDKDEQLKDKNEQLMDKDEQLKVKDKQLKDKDDLLSIQNNKIKDQSEQLKKNEDEINSLRNQTTTSKERRSQFNEAKWCPIVGREGVFKMKIPGVNVFEAPCTENGWMIIQKRMDGSVNFNRSWEDYRKGFGDIHGEFFIGLEKLHLLTEGQPCELNITLGHVNGTTGYAHYSDFEIGSEDKSYYLKSIGNYSGTAGDSLKNHTQMKFYTFDRDSMNCATVIGGGWWFEKCGYSSLNGPYIENGISDNKFGIYWGDFQDFKYNISLTFAQMMIKPKPLQGE